YLIPTICNRCVIDFRERLACKPFFGVGICASQMVQHGLRGWSIAKHIWEQTLPFLQSPQIDDRREMAISVPCETINGLFLAEDSTEIFDDLVNMHSAFACQSSPHLFGCLVVGDRKPRFESELLRSGIARNRIVEGVRALLQSLDVLTQLFGWCRRQGSLNRTP